MLCSQGLRLLTYDTLAHGQEDIGDSIARECRLIGHVHMIMFDQMDQVYLENMTIIVKDIPEASLSEPHFSRCSI